MLQCPRTSDRTSSAVALWGGKRGQAVHGLVLDLAGLDVAPLALDAKRHRAMAQSGLVGVVGEVE